MKTPDIHTLRRNGYKVRVLHSILSREDAIEGIRKTPLAFDGKPNVTIIDITTPDGRDVTGYALRGMFDEYNRKLGNRIALGRALKKLSK